MAFLLTPAVHGSTAEMCVSVPADPFVDARTVLLVDGRQPEDCSCAVTVILLVSAQMSASAPPFPASFAAQR